MFEIIKLLLFDIASTPTDPIDTDAEPADADHSPKSTSFWNLLFSPFLFLFNVC